jgi:hypothetical protein
MDLRDFELSVSDNWASHRELGRKDKEHRFTDDR